MINGRPDVMPVGIKQIVFTEKVNRGEEDIADH